MPKRHSITIKIVFILILIILPLNIISIMSTNKAQKVILEQTTATLRTIMNNSMIYLDTRMKEANNYLFDLVNNDAQGINLLYQTGDSKYIHAKYYIAQKLQTDMSVQNSADVYFAYSPKLDDILISKSIKYSFSRSELGLLLSDPQLLSQYSGWKIFDFDGRQWLMHASYFSRMYYGCLICVDDIVSEIKNSLTYEKYQITATDSENMAADHSKNMHISVGSSKAPFYTHVLLDKKEILSALPFFERVGFSITLLYLLLIPVLLIVLNRILLKPLRKISSAMDHIKSGNKDYRIGHHNYASEFVNINETFNTMADSIDQLTIEKYESELHRQKIELQNLQLQIRPHFLLNTFNLMFSLSQMDDREDLENTILYMADYFRYIFRSGQDLENFEIELNLIKNYLQVANLRYPDGFTITYDIDPKTLFIQIPPLLIHNYVENIIRHALHSHTVVNILLKASLEGNQAEFIIADDGPGMAPELVEKINSETLDTHDCNAHLGMVNAYQRIKFFLGQDALLRIISAPGEGCKIVIRFKISVKQT